MTNVSGRDQSVPFFTTKTQGTGLGLPNCQRIIHDFGGYLEADSGPGGTVLTVWLPAASEAMEKMPYGGALRFDHV